MTNKLFRIKIEYQGGLSRKQKKVFDKATRRWEQCIVGTSVGDSPHVLTIRAIGKEIDGEGQVLGQAGPTKLNNETVLPIEGIMEFDIADLKDMEKKGTLEDIILHEMGHVLGIGTLWERKGLIEKSGTSNPVYVGKKAMVEYATLLGTDDEDDLERPIPVANTGGPGTADGHWRESVFDTELMSGYAEDGYTTMPLSRMTLASLEDLGYNVNYDKADSYVLPPSKEGSLSSATTATRPCYCNKQCPNIIEDSQRTIPHSNAAGPIKGAILEAAFVDPAYGWPLQNQNADVSFEIKSNDDFLLPSDTSPKEEENSQDNGNKAKKTTGRRRLLQRLKCGTGCKQNDAIDEPYDGKQDNGLATMSSINSIAEAEEEETPTTTTQDGTGKYGNIPEGVFIYKLDTSNRTVTLMTNPNPDTDLRTLLRSMTVIHALPSNDKSRRGIILKGEDGSQTELIACEQRTATSWLKAINMMLDDDNDDDDDDTYLSLAKHSNNLILAGEVAFDEEEPTSSNASSSKRKKKKKSTMIYSTIETQKERNYSVTDINEEDEALEMVAKRRAVVKDSWDFYRMLCSLVRDTRKYDEIFKNMTNNDPIYPYVESLVGLNDIPASSSGASDNIEEGAITEKDICQPSLPEYADMTPSQLGKALIQKAESVQPIFNKITKALAGSLWLEEVGIGPIKELQSAIRKADRKYGNDLLKVTDYCRSTIVVKDFTGLIALLELANKSFGHIIKRIKLSTLKRDHVPLAGGYRDCKINLELEGHICEIQIHLFPMWTVCGVDGFRHYRHCLEYKTDDFVDPYEALDGLDTKSISEMIILAEEVVSTHPLSELEWYHEKYIIDYFAEIGLFLQSGEYAWAEVTLRHLIKLRTESKDIGPYHRETLILHKYLARTLNKQNKKREENEIKRKIEKYEKKNSQKDKNIKSMPVSTTTLTQEEGELSLWESMYTYTESLFDPNKLEREYEEKQAKEAREARERWYSIREKEYPFLLENDNGNGNNNNENNNNNNSSENKDNKVTTSRTSSLSSRNDNKNNNNNKKIVDEVHSTASTIDDDSLDSGEERSLISDMDSTVDLYFQQRSSNTGVSAQ